MIEYSNTSLEKDLQLKSKIYARANLVEYWVVNLKTKTLIVFRDPVEGEYQSMQTVTRALICPVSFPGVKLEVKRLVQ